MRRVKLLTPITLPYHFETERNSTADVTSADPATSRETSGSIGRFPKGLPVLRPTSTRGIETRPSRRSPTEAAGFHPGAAAVALFLSADHPSVVPSPSVSGPQSGRHPLADEHSGSAPLFVATPKGCPAARARSAA